MKPHEPKKQEWNNVEKEGGKQRMIKKPIQQKKKRQ
jgi:hypothetical protein